MIDASATVAALQQEIKQLRQDRDLLKERATMLSREVDFLRKHRTLRAGMAGEAIVANLVEGTRTAYGTPHDVERAGVRLEVKFANLNRTSSPSGNHTRWAWGKIFGEGGKKHYDFLILVGVKDPRWEAPYRDQTSLYTFFCIPHNEIEILTQPMNGKRYRAIQLSSNPKAVRRSRAARLYSEFERTYEELQNMFGL